MPTLKWTAGVLSALGVLTFAIAGVVRFGDGPLGPFPGGVLLGEEVAEAVADWSFLDTVDRVELQVNHQRPRSITVWVFTHEGAVYIPAAYAPRKRWPAQVVGDGRVVLRYDQKLYALNAVRIDAPALRSVLAQISARKYNFDPDAVPRDDHWFFRLDPR